MPKHMLSANSFCPFIKKVCLMHSLIVLFQFSFWISHQVKWLWKECIIYCHFLLVCLLLSDNLYWWNYLQIWMWILLFYTHLDIIVTISHTIEYRDFRHRSSVFILEDVLILYHECADVCTLLSYVLPGSVISVRINKTFGSSFSLITDSSSPAT